MSITNADLGVWCVTPDCDGRAPTLGKLLSPAGIIDCLSGTRTADLLSAENEPGLFRARLIAYRMGKRAVLHIPLRSAGCEGGVYLKVFRRPPSARQVGMIGDLSSRLQQDSLGNIRVPEVLDFLPDRQLLITQGVSESPGGSKNPGEVLSDSARALAALHNVHLRPEREHTPQDEFQTLCRWLPVLRLMFEQRPAILRELVGQLAPRARNLQPLGTTLLHRDYYGAQILCTPKHTWILDLDTLSSGDAEVDVSTYVAHLMLDNLVSQATKGSAISQARDFIDHYACAGGKIDARRLGFYLPCAIARLGAIHYARGVRSNVIEQFWSLAHRFLDDQRIL